MMSKKLSTQTMSKLLELCKRTGFLFPSAEIHGGLRGSYDYGVLGTELKRNIQNLWWQDMVHRRPENIVTIDTSILTPKSVFAASGHLSNFSDLLTDCKLSKERFRPDKAEELSLNKFHGNACFQIKAKNTDEAAQWQNELSSQHLNGIRTIRNGSDIYIFYSVFNKPYYEGKLFVPGLLRIINCPEELFNSPPREGLIFSEEVSNIDYIDFPYLGYVSSANSPFLTDPRAFNLMFKTFMGPVDPVKKIIDDTLIQYKEGTSRGDQDAHLHQEVERTVLQNIDGPTVYLRPETAQGVFVNYQYSLKHSGGKLPFGVAQAGKAFRNELAVEYAIFRTPEFEQLELEFFTAPGESTQWFQHWVNVRADWWKRYSNNFDKFRLAQHAEHDLAHYAQACTDIEYDFPWGWGEIEGVANRSDFDLKSHMDATGRKLGYLDAENNYIIPHVIESSSGLNRACLAFLFDAFTLEPETNRVILKLHPALAPIKVAILPLIAKPELLDVSQQLTDRFQNKAIPCKLISQTLKIGKRYYRQDEIGTPWCITVDFKTLEDHTVTLRHRDTQLQDRIHIDSVVSHIQSLLLASLKSPEDTPFRIPKIEPSEVPTQE
ncbi:hypothetical protein DSO57_1026109 [Entomophthora muscae]|uniref:Uncharacterized protein n=1 Tax=Entomophthora muscae TaxID=34485 RepID=A0ACC2RT29_9FUNG|nr:hypothetical protein DSO57_1026109 [Entomophthora muscae]